MDHAHRQRGPDRGLRRHRARGRFGPGRDEDPRGADHRHVREGLREVSDQALRGGVGRPRTCTQWRQPAPQARAEPAAEDGQAPNHAVWAPHRLQHPHAAQNPVVLEIPAAKAR